MKKLLVLILFIFDLDTITASHYVPVIMWDNVPNTLRLPTLNTLSMSEFEDLIKKKFQADRNLSVLIFGENSLNLEDLTYQPNDVDLFKGMMDKLVRRDGLQLNFLLQVENPIVASSHSDVPTTIILTDDMIQPGRPGEIIIINFDEGTYRDRRRMLHDHIQRMQRIYDIWKQGVKSRLVFITGRRSRRLIDGESMQWIREKSATDVVKGTLMETPDVNIYVVGDVLFGNDKTNEILRKCPPPPKKTKDGVNLIYFKLCGASEEITLNFEVRPNGNWALKSATFGKIGQFPGKPIPTTVAAPANFSYHCSKFVIKTRDKDMLTMNEFQAQPVMNKTKSFKFSQAVDCAGLTSKGILGGIMIAFLMLSVAFYSVWMIGSIQTNDLMDDPKGARVPIMVHG